MHRGEDAVGTDERMTINPNWSQAERRVRGYVGLNRFAERLGCSTEYAFGVGVFSQGIELIQSLTCLLVEVVSVGKSRSF